MAKKKKSCREPEIFLLEILLKLENQRTYLTASLDKLWNRELGHGGKGEL
jgi:hypothetical protein